MGYPGRSNIYEAAIKRMVTDALEAQEEEFRRVHGADTDAQLLGYLRECAAKLGHSPWPREIAGGGLIEQRFGSWKRALALARLPAPQTADQYSAFDRVKEETERQKALYRQKKSEKKAQAEKRRVQQTAKRKQSE